MRKKPIVVLSSGVLVGAALAVVAFYSSCGSTGGGNDPIAATSQFVSQSCAPAGPFGGGPCLSLQTQVSIPADGASIGGFKARLIDGSGTPLPGVQICFAFENPAVATIIEPTNACGLTDQNGLVSGQFRAGSNPGSFALVATPQAGFALQIRRTIHFSSAGDGGGGGAGGTGCTTGSDCPSGQCSSNAAVCGDGLGACCLSASGDPCGSDAECASSLECNGGTCGVEATPVPTAVVTAVPIPTATPAQTNGTACTANAQCQSSCCCATAVAPFSNNTCLAFGVEQCTACL